MTLDCNKPKPCVPVVPPKEIYPPATTPFDMCVGDFALHWDGTRLTQERVRTTPDGSYSQVTMVNGCAVDYGYCPEPIYTPPYCNPTPTSCSTTAVSNVTISPLVDNTLQETPAGLYAHTYIQGGSNIAVTGTGTPTDPLNIAYVGDGSQTALKAVVGRNGISSEIDPTGVTYVGLQTSGVKAGIYGNITVNTYGQITDISEGDSQVGAGAGLIATKSGDQTIIAHPTVVIDSPLNIGGYTLTLNGTGHITGTQRNVTLDAGTYMLGAYNVTIDSTGAITAIEQNEAVVLKPGTFRSLDNKLVTYDTTGRIVSVE